MYCAHVLISISRMYFSCSYSLQGIVGRIHRKCFVSRTYIQPMPRQAVQMPVRSVCATISSGGGACPCNNGTIPNRRCLTRYPNSRCISCSCPQVVCMADLWLQPRTSKRRSEYRRPQVCVSCLAVLPCPRSFSDAPAL